VPNWPGDSRDIVASILSPFSQPPASNTPQPTNAVPRPPVLLRPRPPAPRPFSRPPAARHSFGAFLSPPHHCIITFLSPPHPRLFVPSALSLFHRRPRFRLVPITESTVVESKLELDAFGEPRVMAWLPKVKTSPRKLNLVAKLVRRMGLEQALMQLRFCSKKMADVVSKTIHDAKWNAVNNNVRARPRNHLRLFAARLASC